ncbi:MAG: helix-turn-helix transcriptional regulator [Calditrichaceae bacterium]|nr:helix-turn-helix transcriptional regulator [Calditrichaceae bacterium]
MYKYYLFIFFILVVSSNAQGLNFSLDSIKIDYVYMEFGEDHYNIDQNWSRFDEACQAQNLNDYISGSGLSIHFNDQPPVYQLAYPLIKPISVKPPLEMGRKEFLSVIRPYSGPDIMYAIKELELKLQEMHLHQKDATMIRWGEFNSNNMDITEIIIPVQMPASADYVISRVSRLIISVSVFLFVLVGILLLFNKKQNKSNIIFALFLFSLAILSIDWVFGYFRYALFLSSPFLFYIWVPFQFIIAPLLFFYVVSVINKNFHFKKWHIIHFIPFLTVSILLYFRYYHSPADLKRRIYLLGNLFSEGENIAGMIIYNLQLLGYITAAFILIFFFIRQLKNQQAKFNSKQFIWLNLVLFGFLIVSYAGFFKHIFYNYMGIYSEFLYTIKYISLLGFAFTVLYYTSNHPELFSIIDFNLNKLPKVSLSDSLLEKYKTELLEYMETHKPYLDPDISLGKLSEQVSIPPRSLSEVINRSFGMNFFEFINTYRIKEAKKQIAGSCENKKTILEVLYEVGYNNKSVFNSVFKKYTGMTPTEYRAEIIN